MIFGSCSFLINHSITPVIEFSVRCFPEQELQKIDCKFFSGGYSLNHKLPYRSEDFSFLDENLDLLILLSGSIYNKPELCRFSGLKENISDPELIASLFSREGVPFVTRLNGDFVIFILQSRSKSAYLFRDHVGIRPIAFTYFNHSLVFSSDIIGICSSISTDQCPDRDYLLGAFRNIDLKKTPDSRVEKLLPGHYLTFSEEGIVQKKYWNPAEIRIDSSISYPKMIADLKDLLFDSIKIRCDNRFFAGSHVSGGIDSGFVASVARDEFESQNNFFGFSWSPADFDSSKMKFDERELVRLFCKKKNIIPVFSDIDTDRLNSKINSFSSNQGNFVEDVILDQAAERGVNLLFSGWGGDEFISVNDRGVNQDLVFGLKFSTFFRHNKISNLKSFIRSILFTVIYPMIGILDRGVKKTFEAEVRYIKKPFKKANRKILKNIYFHSSRRQHQLRFLEIYHLQDRCEKWYMNGYRKGVEYRFPLLDKRIIEYILKVPSGLLCEDDIFRPFLRRIAQGILPEEIRLHTEKEDIVQQAHILILFEKAAMSSIDQMDEWKENSCLDFIDFNLLKTDIQRLETDSEKLDKLNLFVTIVFVRALHEFVKSYRSEIRYGKDKVQSKQ